MTTPTATPPRDRAAAAHGRGRDVLLDLIRSGAIALVVVQHWLMPVITRDGDALVAGNALAAPGAWVWTWAGQVMPLVFFASGAAGAISWARTRDRGGDAAGWLVGRVHRLVLPVAALVVVWLPLPVLLLALGVLGQPVHLAASTVPQLLWFLVVQLVLVALTPLTVALHRRFGLAVLVPLVVGAAAIDALRFAGVPLVGYLNAVLVWVAVHQVGVAYADGRFATPGRRGAALVGFTGLAATAALVGFGPYPASMIGMPGAPVSNMSPPTLCLVTLAIAQLGLLLALRPALVRFASSRPVAAGLAVLAPRTMTVFLWHMSALVVGVGVLTLGFGSHTPDPFGPVWLAGSPLWIVGLLVVLVVLVRAFGSLETRSAAAARRGASPAAVYAGLVLAAAGMLGLAARGFASHVDAGLLAVVAEPAAWSALVAVGYLLATRPFPRVTVPRAGTPASRRAARA
ncbi:acyltransferase family protein [Pseudonocardia sp. D17]|uniref:acyltransferase family protein n=1 Tax=Pseudonocardia sp. D17 TaxID=882661 RepID=UPI002B3D51A1|nr:acyltransferase [Pseudonocardia sp. D17]